MFHDVAIKFRFLPDGRPQWAVSIAGPSDGYAVVGFGESLTGASWEAQSAARRRDAGEDLGTSQEAADFFAPARTA